MSYDQAYKQWYQASISKKQRVWEIIENIIKNGTIVPNIDGEPENSVNRRKGFPILLNRNPTISYGSIQQMFVVGITDTYTLGISLQVIPAFVADFDGDVLNILYIINREFFNECYLIYNPRNAMFISRNDGLFNNDFNHSRDTIVNINSFIYMTRDKYSQEMIDKINYLKKLN